MRNAKIKNPNDIYFEVQYYSEKGGVNDAHGFHEAGVEVPFELYSIEIRSNDDCTLLRSYCEEEIKDILEAHYFSQKNKVLTKNSNVLQ